MPHYETRHLRLVPGKDRPTKKPRQKNWRTRFARAAGEILRAPATKFALFGTSAIMAADYAAHGNPFNSLSLGILSGFGTFIIGRNLQAAVVGSALTVTCVLGAVAAGSWVEQQRKTDDPLPAMMASNDLGPRTIISDAPLTRNRVDVTTIIGKIDRLDPATSGVTTPLECTRYWVIRHNNLPREQSDNPELRQFDLKQPDTAQRGDCAALDAWRTREIERALGSTRRMTFLSATP